MLALRGGRTIVVTVARRRDGERLADLAGDALRGRAATRASLRVCRRRPSTFRLGAQGQRRPGVRASDAVLAGVEAALRAAYSFAARGFARAGAPLGGRRGRHRCRRRRGRPRPALPGTDADPRRARCSPSPAVRGRAATRSPAELLAARPGAARLAGGCMT